MFSDNFFAIFVFLQSLPPGAKINIYSLKVFAPGKFSNFFDIISWKYTSAAVLCESLNTTPTKKRNTDFPFI